MLKTDFFFKKKCLLYFCYLLQPLHLRNFKKCSLVVFFWEFENRLMFSNRTEKYQLRYIYIVMKLLPQVSN